MKAITLEVTGVEAEVCQDISARQLKGIEKYGTTVADNPLALREWIQHAYEESLDKSVYLKKILEELDTILSGQPEKAPSKIRLFKDLPIGTRFIYLDKNHKPIDYKVWVVVSHVDAGVVAEYVAWNSSRKLQRLTAFADTITSHNSDYVECV